MRALRKLVQSYSEGSISREEYLHVRTLLLNKLEKSGDIQEHDLENFLNLKNVSNSNSSSLKYDFSDISIALLGLIAAATLAYILYS